MSKNIKALVGLIVVVVIIIIGIIIWGGKGSGSSSTSESMIQAPTSNTVNTQSVSSTSDAGLTTSPTDSSNAALQSDVNSIDAQMNGLNSDLSATTTQITQ